ncbi:MAG: hypothetical protein Q7R73_03000 [bacterium]|nr:hypothetical protein [bacterium]
MSEKSLLAESIGSIGVESALDNMRIVVSVRDSYYWALCCSCLNTSFWWVPGHSKDNEVVNGNMTKQNGEKALLVQCGNCLAVRIMPLDVIVRVEKAS